MPRLHRLYLTPGMFGFGKLASYDYFAHVEHALAKRFADAGERLEAHVVDVAPTASIRRRAARLAELVAGTAKDEGPIHLLGHSTGGLDARLVASPSARLPVDPQRLTWLPRLRSVTTMSTPHYGTPLASFFATVSGQRILYAVSAMTFIGLSVGAPPLAAASALVVAIGQLDRTLLGVELKVLDSATDALLRALEPATSRTVRDYLDAIRRDQGAMIQLTPEAMDLFQSGVEDRDILYQCTCSMAPPPTAARLARAVVGSPWRAISSTLFTFLYGVSSRTDENYPCAASDHGALTIERDLEKLFGAAPTRGANDGVVPTRSQIWGTIAWAGYADHLDILGHYPGAIRPGSSRLGKVWERARGVLGRRRDATSVQKADENTVPVADVDGVHVDWLRSGAGFDDRAFSAVMDALAKGMIGSVENG